MLAGIAIIPQYNLGHEHEFLSGIDVHGGLTFSDYGSNGLAPDEYRFGFDCAHLGDLVPGTQRHGPRLGETYRNIAFVEAECTKLAQQLAAIPRRSDANG